MNSLHGEEVPAALRAQLTRLWADRERYVVLATHFGQGQEFISLWQAWRETAAAGSQLHFISRLDLGSFDAPRPQAVARIDASGAGQWPALQAELRAVWPLRTPDLHHLRLDAGRVHLWLSQGERKAWLSELVASVDAFVIRPEAHEASAGSKPAHWLKALTRLAAPKAALWALNAPPHWAAGLRTAGFDVLDVLDVPSDESAQVRPRHTLVAHFAPPFQRPAAASRASIPIRRSAHATSDDAQVLILGAGLAGCATAWALAEHGWSSRLIDRHAQPAQESSGNPAGLFHGIVNAHDGVHARFNRSAALHAREAAVWAIAHHGAQGQTAGLLRLETRLADAAQMRQLIDRLGLPPGYIQALDAGLASERCGMRLAHPAWLFPGGGWIDPGALARSFLVRAGELTRFLGGTEAQRISHREAQWEVWGPEDQLIGRAPHLVLANAHGALQLLGHTGWPVQRVRGQISLWRGATPLPNPKLPVTGSGYLLPQVNGLALFGATAQAGDDDVSVRADDHLRNLAQLARLTDRVLLADAVKHLEGRVAWRMVCGDRLPLVGPVPDFEALARASPGELRDLRRLARQPGLHVHAALGSRGITWSALCAQVVAADITGAPQPLEAALLEAIDPGRFIVRQHRRRQVG